MRDTINFGIGFVTGRPNVCKVINSTYERLINQFKDSEKKVNITISLHQIYKGDRDRYVEKVNITYEAFY